MAGPSSGGDPYLMVLAGHTPASPEVVLKEHFGYPDFRPGQSELVRAVLAGRDALGILPTGGGKSVCYQVPALMLPGLTLVVSPLVSLMTDQVHRARDSGLAAEALHSGLDPSERDRVEAALSEGVVRLLLLAPERFESARFRALLPGLRVSLLAVDEAHCISMWGHDFRPAYRRLGEVRGRLEAPVLALTATATPRVRDEIEASLHLRGPVRVVGSFDRSNLRWAVVRVPRRTEKVGRIRLLLRNAGGARLVYASTRKRVEGIRNGLARCGLRTEAYHAGLPSAERERVQAYFMEAPAPVVVATNAFGMGIDRSDVRLVVHDQLPGSLEDYYQEAGRAGRDGGPAVCLAFHLAEDAQVHRAFLDQTHPPVRSLRAWAQLRSEGGVRSRWERRRIGLGKLRGVQEYARVRSCRRRALLAWFGEGAAPDRCGGCDRCIGLSGVLEPISSR